MTQNEWIPVSDRLPERNEDVWCYCFEDNPQVGCFVEKKDYGDNEISYLFLNLFGRYISVTHWMPLPAPPKGE